jgi:hypothetical protein
MKRLMSILMVVVLVGTLVGVSSAQAPGPAARQTPAGQAQIPHPNDVLWVQPITTTGWGGWSDEYPAMGFGAYSADDFQNADPWTITMIWVNGFMGAGSLWNAISLNWAVYADAGGTPAGYPGPAPLYNEFFFFSSPPTGPGVIIPPGDEGTVGLDLIAAGIPPLALPPGHSWLVFYPQFATDYLANMWYWYFSDTANLNNAELVDPTNFFGGGWTWWTPWAQVSPDVPYDLAFELDGTIQQQPKMHVGGVTLTKTGTGPWVLTAKGKIHDASHANLPGVTVQAQWLLPNGTKVYRNMVTGAQGGYQFNWNANGQGQFRFCVVGLIKAGWVYDKPANHPAPPCKVINTP